MDSSPSMRRQHRPNRVLRAVQVLLPGRGHARAGRLAHVGAGQAGPQGRAQAHRRSVRVRRGRPGPRPRPAGDRPCRRDGDQDRGHHHLPRLCWVRCRHSPAREASSPNASACRYPANNSSRARSSSSAHISRTPIRCRDASHGGTEKPGDCRAFSRWRSASQIGVGRGPAPCDGRWHSTPSM
jgi:hypothetical protein